MTERLCNDCGIRPLRYNNRSGFCSDCYERNRPRSIVGSEAWIENSNKQKEYYNRKIEHRRHLPKIAKYKITLETYNKMREEQKYCCFICNRHENEVGTLNIDHDHNCCPTDKTNQKTCGKCIRKLLCTDCNQGLGRFRDDVKLLRRAIEYLELL